MKKLIALAVAAASVPAMAAVTVSGSYNVEYVDAHQSETIQSYDVDVAVSASAELNNGTTVSASLEADDSDNDGSITFAGAWGTLAAGDVAGALDAVDGVAIATARDDLSAAATAAGDAGLSYTFPTLVEGLGLKASYSTEQGGNDATADATSVSATYSMAGFSAFFGMQDATVSGSSQDVTGYGVAYTASGFTVGYNASETELAGAKTEETSGVSAGYTTGGLTLAINTAETEDGTGAVTADKQTVSVAYGLGGGVTAYASNTEDDKVANSDTTRVGVKFSF